MRIFEALTIGALALVARVSAQETFESPEFNVTEALIENGVNVSAIPELAGLVVRSSLSGCSIAVGLSQSCETESLLILVIVQLTQARLRWLQGQRQRTSDILVESTEPSRAVLHLQSDRSS